MIAWIFFIAENIGHAINYISGIFSQSLLSVPDFPDRKRAFITIILIVVFFFIEWLGREKQYAISELGIKWKKPLRYAMYYAIIIAIIWFGGKQHQFIYFQF
jgi:asparagine N-glycosylation enzyme membrane subunit Stt3